jgi:hypothetical protein
MKPRLAHIEIDLPWNWIEFEQSQCRFNCLECRSVLQLDRILIRKLEGEHADPVLEHLVNTKVIPWIEQHSECGIKEVAFAV